ncbi:MAG: glucose-6-phosphate dehydrogenase [Anaerolineae bacterium]|nr:MAG: glucose-6-phosphate dehydrogenase [Anaerolineae bacterium]
MDNGLPTSIVIFGASGDLTRRKLVPALFQQCTKGRIPSPINIVGTSRSEYSHDEFRRQMLEGMAELSGIVPDGSHWDEFSKNLWYVPGDISQEGDYGRLEQFLVEKEDGPANRLYYLATAPRFFPVIVKELGKQGMATEGDHWSRVVIEKPFGHDLESAVELNEIVHAAFDEHQVYRIDHYLGKETAQNILYFRFLNTIFEPIWNRNYIDHVQITVTESVDVEHRAGYYDNSGVVRDMFQNHFLQLFTLVAMEPPATFDADAVRNEKVKVLMAIRPIDVEDTVRAQYEGYGQAKGVAENSQTPTFAAMKLYVDNWRWQGVPFYLRSGKALAEKTSQIVIVFKEPPHVLFNLPSDYRLTPNFLSLCIQPDEGMHLRFETKVPGALQETKSVDMEFHYPATFGGERLPDAYERLLIDALSGDPSLFTRSDEIEMAWSLVDPVLEAWESSTRAPTLGLYRKGSWGPPGAEAFIARDERVWRLGCGDRTG